MSTNKQTTTGLDALMNASKTIKLATSQRQSNPAWKQAESLLLDMGADKKAVTIKQIATKQTIDNAVAVFGDVDKFDAENAELMEQFMKLDSKATKVLGTIKGHGKSNVTNNSKTWDVVETNGGFMLKAKEVEKA